MTNLLLILFIAIFIVNSFIENNAKKEYLKLKNKIENIEDYINYLTKN